MKKIYTFLCAHLLLAIFLLTSFTLKAQLRVAPSGQVLIGETTTQSQNSLYISATDISALFIKSNYTINWAASLKSEVNLDNARPFVGKCRDEITFFVTGDGWVNANLGFYQPSDSIFKENCTTITSPLEGVLRLNGIKFDYKDPADVGSTVPKTRSMSLADDSTSRHGHIGVIAQEVEKVFPELIRSDEHGRKLVSYSEFAGIFIESFKAQQAQILEQNKRISELETRFEILEQEMQPESKTMTTSVDERQSKPIQRAVLYANTPNPFSESTTIRFDLPETTREARILVLDLQGELKRDYLLPERGATSLVIAAKELKPGMYLYTLLVDGQQVDTKKMILTGR